eukprot:gene18974-20881_t
MNTRRKSNFLSPTTSLDTSGSLFHRLSKSTEDLSRSKEARRNELLDQGELKLPEIRNGSKSPSLQVRRRKLTCPATQATGINDSLPKATASTLATIAPTKTRGLSMDATLQLIKTTTDDKYYQAKATLIASNMKRQSDRTLRRFSEENDRLRIDSNFVGQRRGQRRDARSTSPINVGGRGDLKSLKKTRGAFFNSKKMRSISLEDIPSSIPGSPVVGPSSTHVVDEVKVHRDGPLSAPTPAWSQHWHYVKLSVNKYPDSPEEHHHCHLDNAFAGMKLTGNDHEAFGDCDYHYYDDNNNNNATRNRGLVLPKLSLEERLLHVERQQGITFDTDDV